MLKGGGITTFFLNLKKKKSLGFIPLYTGIKPYSYVWCYAV